jgi:DNA polymerase V
MPFGHEDFAEAGLDLNERLIRHPAATFFMRRGEDILIVDRAMDPRAGDTIIAIVDGELKLRQFRPGQPTELWGVVTFVIKKMR